MDIVKVMPSYFTMCQSNGLDPNNQLLQNHAGRPCVLLVSLNYRGKKQDFVIPLKSNISKREDVKNFFKLPPNKNTKSGNRHGVHYIKLFPVSSRYIQPYLYEGDKFFTMIAEIINKNEKEIVNACQNYLNEYEKGNRNLFTPMIDLIIPYL